MITHYKIPKGSFVGCVRNNTNHSHYLPNDKLFSESEMIEKNVQQGNYFKYHKLKDTETGSVYSVSVHDVEEILSY